MKYINRIAVLWFVLFLFYVSPHKMFHKEYDFFSVNERGD